MNSNLVQKLEQLKSYMADLKQVTVGYSGGVDSALVAKIAYDVLGDSAVAVTVVTEFEAADDIDSAVRTAREIGIHHQLVHHSILSHNEVASNPTNRCFYCKHNSFSVIEGPNRLDGNNASDDAGDRPGMQALRALGVRSPLRDCGITKDEVRELARSFGMQVADRPANSCLASRIKPGTAISPALLETVERGEEILRRVGLRDVRLRHRGAVALVETLNEEQHVVEREKVRLVAELKTLGFSEIEFGIRRPS